MAMNSESNTEYESMRDNDFQSPTIEAFFDSPKSLTRSAGSSACCIFKIPECLGVLYGGSYKPDVVSIGPYHRDRKDLQMVQEHKLPYLRSWLRWTGTRLEHLIDAIRPMVRDARACYSMVVDMLDDDFVLELFRNASNGNGDDPLPVMPWLRSAIHYDLIKLENQIPFFILKSLFDRSTGEARSLARLALAYFGKGDVIDEAIEPKHLLDLYRRAYIDQAFPRSAEVTGQVNVELNGQDNEHFEVGNQNPRDKFQWVHCLSCIPGLCKSGSKIKECGEDWRPLPSVSKLRKKGIKFANREAASYLSVEFKGGILHMPTLAIGDSTPIFLLNSILYEQFSVEWGMYFTTYVLFLNMLVDTSEDVEHLCEMKIIQSFVGSSEEVATKINNMGNKAVFYRDEFYLAPVVQDIHTYIDNNLHVHWASFKSTYFNSPWSFISVFAAVMLLGLTLAQTIYTICGFYKPCKG